MTLYKSTFFECGCGFKSIQSGNASWHKKKCNKGMKSGSKTFVLEEDIHCSRTETPPPGTDDVSRVKILEDTVMRLQRSLSKLSMTVTDVIDDDDNVDVVRSGLIYFIVDRDVPDRGKIGRTKNTDVRKLKSRYSTFGNPIIHVYWSECIQKDENDLKTCMRDAGCMRSNTEMISNVPLAREVFYEFVENIHTD